jgi:putative membrane protein
MACSLRNGIESHGQLPVALNYRRNSDLASASFPAEKQASGDCKMETPPQLTQTFGISDFLAAERTLLAWIRTGLALMGFGFVVARFGLFLQELQSAQRAPSVQTYGLSLWFGTVLIGAGVAVNLLSAWRHARLIRNMDRGQPFRPFAASLAIAVSLFLALLGFGMAIYLISVHNSTH